MIDDPRPPRARWAQINQHVAGPVAIVKLDKKVSGVEDGEITKTTETLRQLLDQYMTPACKAAPGQRLVPQFPHYLIHPHLSVH